jgi:hypothetical protein
VTDPGYLPYEPQGRPVAWADDVWIVDGPEVGYRLAGLTVPCPTRMTVVRLGDGTVWVHSPVAWSEALAAALARLGTVGQIVAPSSYHHLHVAAWQTAFPAAQVHACPGLLRSPTARDWISLGQSAPAAWRVSIDQLLVDLGSFEEVIFFHRPSRTLIVTDLMQNFEAARVRNPFTRLLLKAGGATGPNGRASIEIRLAGRGRHRELRAAVRQMADWAPTSILLSHGACFRVDAVAELCRAFAWAGPDARA